MTRRDNVQFALLVLIGLAATVTGWFLPAPASYVCAVIAAICIGGLALRHADLLSKIKEERRQLLRRELRERSHRDPDN